MLRLFRDVEGVRGVHLHPISQFEGLDAGFHLRILGPAPGVLFVELLQQIKLLALLAS